MERKIAYLSMNYPYPSDMGQKLITNYDIKVITSLKTECLLFSFIHNDDKRDYIKEEQSGISFANPLQFNMHAKYHLIDAFKTLLKSFLCLIPFNVAKSYKWSYKIRLKAELTEFDPDIIYFDHIGHLPYIKFLEKTFPTKKFIYKAHDYAADVFGELFNQERNLVKKIYFKYNQVVMKRMDNRAVKLCSKVIFINELVKERFHSEFHNDNKKFVNDVNQFLGKFNEFEEKEIMPIKPAERFNLLIIASFNYIPNSIGLKWFIENVWFEIRDHVENSKLLVVGSKSELFDSRKDGIYGYGRVKDLSPYYEMSDIFILPLFEGSGLRLKVVEAIKNYMPIVSTSKGFDGIDLVDNIHLKVANDKNEFLKSIIELSEGDMHYDLVRNSYRKFSDLDFKSYQEPFLQAFNGL